jgi:hypothetical protein
MKFIICLKPVWLKKGFNLLNQVFILLKLFLPLQLKNKNYGIKMWYYRFDQYW